MAEEKDNELRYDFQLALSEHISKVADYLVHLISFHDKESPGWRAKKYGYEVSVLKLKQDD